MDCREFKELTPAFALGALDDTERGACADHLAKVGPHEGCLDAVAEAQAIAARLSSLLPDREPHPRVWRAIEAGMAQRVPDPRVRRMAWRELGGWFVAAAVLGLYLYKTPVNTSGRADAALDPPVTIKRAMTLMMAPDTQRYIFESKENGPTRGSLIVNVGERNAVVLVDRVGPELRRGLRLWAVRKNDASPVLLTRLPAAVDGTASAELGTALFEPTLPDSLLLSIDPPDATAPGSVLLVARLGK